MDSIETTVENHGKQRARLSADAFEVKTDLAVQDSISAVCSRLIVVDPVEHERLLKAETLE
jgi:hypothetical protein